MNDLQNRINTLLAYGLEPKNNLEKIKCITVAQKRLKIRMPEIDTFITNASPSEIVNAFRHYSYRENEVLSDYGIHLSHSVRLWSIYYSYHSLQEYIQKNGTETLRFKWALAKTKRQLNKGRFKNKAVKSANRHDFRITFGDAKWSSKANKQLRRHGAIPMLKKSIAGLLRIDKGYATWNARAIYSDKAIRSFRHTFRPYLAKIQASQVRNSVYRTVFGNLAPISTHVFAVSLAQNMHLFPRKI